MMHIQLAFWGGLALLSGLWLLTDPGALAPGSFIALRNSMVQYSGIVAMGKVDLAHAAAPDQTVDQKGANAGAGRERAGLDAACRRYRRFEERGFCI